MRADPKREAMFGVPVAPGKPELLAKRPVADSPVSIANGHASAPATFPPLRESDIHLGDAAAGAVGLDLQRLVAHRMLIQANSGAGKSYLLRRLIEQAWGRVQQLVLDPDGEFVTLAEKFDVAILAAGEVSRKGAREVAAHLRRNRCSAVLDLSDAASEDRVLLVAEFVTGLVEAPAECWHPLLVHVDEAQTVAPHYDTGEIPKEIKKRCVAALADMMGRGRKRGIAGVIATPRLAETSKAVTAKAGNILVGRTTMDVDRDRAGKLLGYTVGGARFLSGLADGEFVAIGPALAGGRRVRFRSGAVQTSHKGATPELTPPPAIGAASVAALVQAMPDAGARQDGELTGEREERSPQRRIMVVNGVRGWRPAEDAIVRDGYARKLTMKQIADALEAAGFKRRSMGGISARGQALGMSSDRYTAEWNEAEDELLRTEYKKGTRIVDIAAKLTDYGPGRSRQSVQMRAIHLGITIDRVNYWSERETAIALAVLKKGGASQDVLIALKKAGFERGPTSISKFRAKHGLHKPVKQPWSEAEIATLRERYEQRTPVRAIAAELGKQMGAVTTMAHKLGIKQRTAWSRAEERALVEAHEKGERLIDAAERIRRPYANVAAAAKRMGLSFQRGAR